MTYLWEISNDYREELIGEYDRDQSSDRFLLKRGEPVSPDFGVPTFRFSADASTLAGLDDLANSAMVPLVSEKVQTVLLEKCPEDVQLLDARIITTNGKELAGFKVVVAVKTVAAIDHNISEYSLVPGTQQIMGFTSLRCRPGALGDASVARDKECLSNLLVSDDLRDLLVDRGCQLGLYRPEEMSW